MKRPLFIALSLIVAIGMLLSACAPAATPAPTKAPDPTKAPEPTKAPVATKAPEPTKPPEPTKTTAPTAVPTVAKIKVRIATDATYPPFESVNDKTKELEGFDIDLMKAIATKAGFEVEFVNINFDALLAGMGTCQYDLAISATTITEERKKTMLFSDPYINAGQIVAVKKENTTIKGKDDLVSKKIGVQISTTGAIEAGKIKGATVKSYDTVDLAFLDLANGQVDAVVADYPTTLNFVAKNDKLKVVGEVFTDENYGVVGCKTKGDLITKVNAALAELKKEGFIKTLEDKWVKQ